MNKVLRETGRGGGRKCISQPFPPNSYHQAVFPYSTNPFSNADGGFQKLVECEH